MTSANQIQVAGTHYKNKAIQPWDYIISNNIGYLEGNVIKYVSRWRDKGGVDDLKKMLMRGLIVSHCNAAHPSIIKIS